MKQVNQGFSRLKWPLGLGLSFAFVAAVIAQTAAPTAKPSAKVNVKPSIEIGKQLAESKGCVGCHGAQGQGDGSDKTAPKPSLAGQHSEYLVKQLREFKKASGSKDFKDTEVRKSAIMTAQAAALSDEDMLHLAAYFASLPVVNNINEVGNRKLYDLGKKIYRAGVPDKGVPACTACHGPAGAGLPSQFPRLSGQHYNYGRNQLLAFRSGSRIEFPKPEDVPSLYRRNDPKAMMRSIASRLNDEEIDALASYLAGLK